ncbi:MAG TPA: 16S rRNA (adenine(1518)-N(6)/adenine(1519)-N(6))-dimethyltransferase RsmA [Candidatus Limnocylindrales bacterium]|nr:16S rRNA (adenine(1518)-N(6)/adenine(1519)-N(6))-dimethyltransferase RsmA [Candidatus Limnocylindrales bacterium]
MPTGADPLDARHLGPEQVRRYLARSGLAARKGLSQNFLADGEVLEAIVEAAAPGRGRRVLEIGPGLGVLTGALLASGCDVTAVELDRRMVAHLRTRFAEALAAGGPAGRLRLVEGDALDLALDALLEAPFDLVANLPYHITSPILHHVLGGEPRPERFVLMLQREVAERIAAPPGGMSYLSVFVQYHAAVRVLRVVPPAAFEPAPEVDSAVLTGETRPRRLSAEAEEALWRLVQAGFRERRKMLHNVLPRQLPAVGRERFERALAEVGIAADRRPQTLSVEEWLALAAALGSLGPPP